MYSWPEITHMPQLLPLLPTCPRSTWYQSHNQRCIPWPIGEAQFELQCMWTTCNNNLKTIQNWVNTNLLKNMTVWSTAIFGWCLHRTPGQQLFQCIHDVLLCLLPPLSLILGLKTITLNFLHTSSSISWLVQMQSQPTRQLTVFIHFRIAIRVTDSLCSLASRYCCPGYKWVHVCQLGSESPHFVTSHQCVSCLLPKLS